MEGVASRCGCSLLAIAASALALLAGTTACGAFGADNANAGDAGASDAGASDAQSSSFDSSTGGDSGSCSSLLSAVAIATTGKGGQVSTSGNDTLVTFAANTDGSSKVVRGEATVVMPVDATLLRLEAEVTFEYSWDATPAKWPDGAYTGVLGVVGGTTYGTDPQASLSIAQGILQLNEFPNGTDVQGTQRLVNVGNAGKSGGSASLTLVVDFSAATMGARVSGTAPNGAVVGTVPGSVGVRPTSGVFTIYVGGGAGGAVAPAIGLRFHRLCVAFDR